MSEDQSKHGRRLGCLLLAIAPLVIVLILYEALYYNPIRLIDERQLADALGNGLLSECDTLLAHSGNDSSRPSIDQWPAVIRKLHPRGVFVYPRKPRVVYIELWKNYREWEAHSILGIWMEKGACGFSLIVYANAPTDDPPERGNDEPLVPYYMRKVADRVYLQYPKRMEVKVLKHTDLVRLGK